MTKVRIQRKRKPLLAPQTKQMFAFGSFCTQFMKFFATYGGNGERDAYMRVQIENRRQDTRVKAIRESYVVEQTRRQELLNIEKRLKLEQEFGPERVAELLGEKPATNGGFDAPHTV